MQLVQLKLRNFRNYAEFCADFYDHINLIVGDNAQGKTNLLESIYYLSTGHSWRTRREQELCTLGAEFCEMQGIIQTSDRNQTIRNVLFPGRKSKQIFIGGVKQKSAAALTEYLKCVLFCPDDLQILKAGSAQRRRFLDAALCQLRPRYAAALTEYNRLLEQKSALLREGKNHPGFYAALPDFSARMVQVGSILVEYRAKYLSALQKEANRYHNDFSSGRESLQLSYETIAEDPMADLETIRQSLQEHMQRHEIAERESGQCLSGPHKDDFTATLNEMSIKTFGSQGQTRSAAISLKLAERELLYRDTGEEPLLLLDDVLSELDPSRQNYVLNQIGSGQVFITCCESEKITKTGKIFKIKQGELCIE